MRLVITVAFAAALLATSTLAQMPPARAPTLTGTIRSFDGKSITLSATDGTMPTAQVTLATRITINVRKTVADIKPGDFIASGGTMGPDGKLHADEIRIFTAPGGEGQFPMTLPGQTMTNATVKEVMTDATVKQVGGAAGAPIIKLTFHGAGAPGAKNCTGRAADAPGGAGKGCIGETQFDVPANTPVVAQTPSDASALKPGAKVTVNLTKVEDGTAIAARIVVSP
jgi:hypothetical protein